jgi:WD40 repeat protein
MLLCGHQELRIGKEECATLSTPIRGLSVCAKPCVMALLFLLIPDLTTGACPPSPEPPGGHIGDGFPPSTILTFAMSGDGQRVSAFVADGTVLLWEVAAGKQSELVPCFNRSMDAMAFHPFGKLLALGDADGIIQLLDLPSARVLARIDKEMDWIEGMLFSEDGKKLAVLHHKGVAVWEWETGTLVLSLPLLSNGDTIALNAGGSLLAVGGEGRVIQVWDVSHQRLLSELPQESDEKEWVNSLVFSLDSQHLVSSHGSGAIKIWNPMTGRLIRTLKGHTDQATGLFVLRDGTTFVSIGDDEKVRFWSLQTGQMLRSPGVPIGFVNSDGTFIVSGDLESGTLEIWSLESQKKVRSLIYKSPQEQ